ncbi:MAG: hypothetical protein LBH42_03175 [Treponema sp.]|nr:hypothetical protein [Treponema sp.]
MNKRIINFEIDGKPVLGFDTGLNARSFAQAKLALFITQPGSIVYPDGKVETWQAGGVTEYGSLNAATMIIWGIQFPGEELTEIINNHSRKEEALNALRFWLKARMVIERSSEKGMEPFPGPAGALVVTEKSFGHEQYPAGTVFFPPANLLKRSLDADGASLEAERFYHPDLEDSDGISFSAAAILYVIFCGESPFKHDNPVELRQDMREAVFIPPNLAAPGLDPEMSDLISRALGCKPDLSEKKQKLTPGIIDDFLGSSKPVSSWIKHLDDNEKVKIYAERERFEKKKTLQVKTKRFAIRNAVIITGCFIAFIVILLTAREIARSQAEKPTTKGMSPIEVVESYYHAFSDMDHITMEACVSKTGKEDIQTVTNLFVIRKVRQAYEMLDPLMPAQEWFDTGRPDTDRIVFGITDLQIILLLDDEKNTIIEANYILWTPAGFSQDTSPEDTSPIPMGLITKDTLNLAFQKNAWHITSIDRTIR